MASVPVWQPVVAAQCSTHVALKAASVSQPNRQRVLPAGLTGLRSEDYDRSRRIVKTDEFSSVFRLRPAFRTANFTLYVRANELPHARLGVVVAKRLAPRAVTRNMIKRIARELFRKADLQAVDCIVRLSKPIAKRPQTASSQAMRVSLAAELSRLLQSQQTQEVVQ